MDELKKLHHRKVVTKRDTPERVRVATSRYDWLRFVTVRDRLLPLFAGFFRPASVLLSPERDAYCTKEMIQWQITKRKPPHW